MADRLQYNIAGNILQIFSDYRKLIEDSLPEFGLFADLQESPESPVRIFCTHDSDCITIYDNEYEIVLIYKFDLGDDVCRLFRRDELYFFTIERSDGKCVLMAGMNPGSQDINFSMKKGEVKPYHFKFAVWIVLAFTGIPKHIAPVHSSVIVYNGKAILFLGESGTGKSTHTKLWVINIPEATLLNDDSPVLTVKDGTPYIYGSPWSGKGECYVNSGYPVTAIVRINQSKENRIELLPKLGAFCALYPSFPPAFLRDAYFEDHICGFISEVLKNVPVYTLHCRPDREAAFLVLDTVYKSSTNSI